MALERTPVIAAGHPNMGRLGAGKWLGDVGRRIVALNATGGEMSDGITLTPKAIEMAKKAIEKRGTPTQGLRLGVKGSGCSGVAYAIDFADKIRGSDHVFDFEGLKVVVDPKSLVYLRGSTLDYEVKLMQHGFKFVNPNEKSKCGCGGSFTV